ncbi:hypothetical protein AK95_29355 [Paenibacillus sp. LC231]|uniref:hypothetical protein n=1 Tax=Paenibacillus sp. LC231 TaxID=1120679 RepID=UPI0008DCE6B5|nr:hypothetical protein [Paenibacillus sp. LC231]OIB01526.1 hypothetical protein AK95_29355 [Paenibacillus sp. LC231]
MIGIFLQSETKSFNYTTAKEMVCQTSYGLAVTDLRSAIFANGTVLQELPDTEPDKLPISDLVSP